MFQNLTQEHLDQLKANGVQILTLDEYQQKINPWGFEINTQYLKDMAAANSYNINDDLRIEYYTSKAVLTQKVEGKLVGCFNVKGYGLIAQDDPKRVSFQEFRMTEPYLLFNNKLWLI